MCRCPKPQQDSPPVFLSGRSYIEAERNTEACNILLRLLGTKHQKGGMKYKRGPITYAGNTQALSLYLLTVK